MKEQDTQHFLLSLKDYRNDKLNLFVDTDIQAPDESQFKAVLPLKCGLEIEPDWCLKDAYVEQLGIEVDSNNLLPEAELDFYQAHRRYKINHYSQTAHGLVRQVENYIAALRTRMTFQIIIAPEDSAC